MIPHPTGPPGPASRPGPGPDSGPGPRTGSGSLTTRLIEHAVRQAHPEAMVGAVIVAIWTTLAAAGGGPWGVVIVAGLGLGLHAVAVDTGSHVALWFASGFLLLVVVGVMAGRFDGAPPVLLAAGAATVLAHNELVRVNSTRRRGAAIDPEIFWSSALALALAAGLGLVGTAVADASTSTRDRSWLWIPVATGVLIVVGSALALAPTRRAPKATHRRWQPGQRIPPAPRIENDDGLA